MDQTFLTVGIGASAGGIKALRQFFERVPAESGLAYVVILHLSPDHESHLAEVLQVVATIPVHQVSSRVRIEPNHVYVIPPTKSLTMSDGDLLLNDITDFGERRAPVDIFFRTMADARRGDAVAVILSGTGGNGSMGLKRVKERGGSCFVQDPDEAEYADMPRHAIATGLVDHVLPVAEIPGRILEFRERRAAIRLLDESPGPAPTTDETALRDVIAQLRVRTGHDFSNYKRATVLRRCARRMAVQGLSTLPEYAQFFRAHPDEAPRLLKDLLISVTNFFRDRPAFEALEENVIPALFAGKSESDSVRVWVAGCATGEEAYSVAILLQEHAFGISGAPMIQVFATDIDAGALAAARAGLYTLNDAADVSPERIRRFFTKEGALYRVRKELRDLVLFAEHNITRDPPFSHLDLLSCRNLLIYLNRTAQERALHIMHFALNPDGFLFLGTSESAEAASELFASFDADARIVRSRRLSTRIGLTLDPGIGPLVGLRSPAEREARERLSLAGVHQRLLEEYASPSLVVDEAHEIVHLSDRAGVYLQHGGGDPSHNVLKVIRPELRLELRTALHQAAQERSSVKAAGIPITIADRPTTVNLIVRPVLRESDAARGFFLVLFEETEPAVDVEAPPAAIQRTGVVRQLEEELLQARAHLRATTEYHETQAEELKASNEELQALNEELRSSTEELETSKEELQSLNEELRTVNQELKSKVDELTQANDDIQNLITTAEIGTIFVDRTYRIKLFTPKARDIFNLIATDRGRPLSDMNSILVNADLQADLARVIDRLERIEREVCTRDGHWLLMRAVPYRTADEHIEGVVVTFVDISERKRNETALIETKEALAGELAAWQVLDARLRYVVDSVVDYAIFTLDTRGIINSWNPGARAMFGYAEEEILGQPGDVLFTPEDRAANAPAEEIRQAREGGRASDDRWHLRKDGTRFYVSGIMAPLLDAQHGLVGFGKIARDLTERKEWEDKLERAHADLEARVDERTHALESANRALDQELRERRLADERIRSLMGRLITVQEDERRRIAQDLHDHLGQQVAGLRLKLEMLHSAPASKSEKGARLADALTHLAKLDRDLDFFTWELRPAALDDLGLVTAIRNYVAEWARNFGVAAEFHTSRLENLRLGYETETSLYRITQEALNNIYKHAKAKQAGVLLERRDSHVVLIIEDDGEGFDMTTTNDAAQDRGMGLLGIRERAALAGGTMDLETEPGNGTTIFVRVPIPAKAETHDDSAQA